MNKNEFYHNVKSNCIELFYSLATIVVIAFLFVLLCISLGSCSPKVVTVPVEKVRIDTLKETKWQKDSVWLHDSVYVHAKGDTVLIEKWHTRWADRLLIDTIYQHRVDSVPMPYPVEKEVPAELSWWQKLRMRMGEMMLMLLIAALLYGVYRIKKKVIL